MDTPITLRDILVVVFKRKSIILIVLIATIATVTVGAFWLTPAYNATSILLVKFGREHLYRSEMGEGGAIVNAHLGRIQEGLASSEIQILTSRDLAEQVITTLGVKRLYPHLVNTSTSRESHLEAAITLFQRHLTAEGMKKSDVVHVSFRHSDPRTAAQTVNLLVDLFKARRLRIYKVPDVSIFLEEQVEAYWQRLKTSEEKLRVFEQTHQVFSHEQQRSLLLAQRMDGKTALNAAQSRVAELQERHTSLDRQMRTMAETTPLATEPDAIIDEARSRLFNLQLRRQELLRQFKERHPQVINIQKEIQLAQTFLKSREKASRGRVTIGKNVVYQDLQKEKVQVRADLQSQEAKITVLEQQRAQVDRELQTLSLRAQELRDLQRRLARSEKNYQIYADRLETARVSDEMDRRKLANISVVQPATAPMKPVWPRRRLLIVLGVVVGAVAGMGLALFAEYLGQDFNTPGSVERRLELPVLATVSYKRY